MKGSEFIFDFVELLYYKCHKINPNCGGSYIDSPDWVKNKKATINPIPYAVTVALNQKRMIGKNLRKIAIQLHLIFFMLKKKKIDFKT